MAEKVSNMPWGNFKESDYTLAQWAAACLVKPDGGVTAKSQCKLPVRSPDGVLNRNGVRAAAAALAGARGGVDLTPDERAQASKELVRLYGVMGDDVPASLKHDDMTDSEETPSTAVLVAVPNALDPIRLVGDGDKHATLLYFGETATLPTNARSVLTKMVAEVANIFQEFGARIEGIQRLGPDTPPALVAMLDGDCLKKIRDMLLLNPQVGEFLSNAKQYPDYTPHVTLGYPDYLDEDKMRELAALLFRVRFDRLALWWNGEQTEFKLSQDDNEGESDDSGEMDHAEKIEVFLEHFGTKGMKWGVRKDERPLALGDKALNLSQRSQVKIASAVSTLAAIGIASNAAATAFQLQSRWEHLKIAEAIMQQAQNNPLLNDAAKQALKSTRSNIIKGLVTSAAATTAISTTIGVVTHRTAKAYFAPIHKVYGDVKPQIKGDLRQLSKDIKSGKRSKMTDKEYYAEVSKIVAKHMTKDRSNIVTPFHELARSQLGLEYNTKQLKIKFEKLPNTELYSKMTVTTPTGLRLVKAIKNVQHADDQTEDDGPMPDLDLYFDYVFDDDGFISDFSCPTLDIANDMFEGSFDFDKLAEQYDQGGASTMDSAQHSEFSSVDAYLAHHGVKGMKWGVRKDAFAAFQQSGTGPVGILGRGLSNKEADQLARVTAYAMHLPKNIAAEYGPKLNAINDRYEIHNPKSALQTNDKVYRAYREETRTLLESTLNKAMPEGLHAKLYASKSINGPRMLVVGNKAGIKELEPMLLKGDHQLHHVDGSRLAQVFILDEDVDSNGYLTGSWSVKPIDASKMTHSEFSSVDAYLAHHGVKGMKWGVRRANPSGGGTLLKGISELGTIGNVSLAARPGDHTRSHLKGFGLNLLGPIGTSFLNPVAARYGDVHQVIARKTAALNSEYSQPKKNLATNRSLQSSYDKAYQKIIMDSFKNVQVKGIPLPSYSAKNALKRIGDPKDLRFDFTMESGRKKDKAYLTITTGTGKSEEFQLGTFKAPKQPKIKHADDSSNSVQLDVILTRDSQGYITGFSIPDLEKISDSNSTQSETLSVAKHSEFSSVEAYLVHHGVKGMKWGVRRSDAQLGRAATVRSAKESTAGKVAIATGRGAGKAAMAVGRGGKKAAIALKNRHADKKLSDKMEISQEAAKFIREHQGKGSAMSDQQLRDTIARANLLTQYDSIFNKGKNPNAELQAKVAKLQLEAQKKSAEAQIRGAKVKKVKDLVELSEKSFEAYNKLNKASGGALNKQMSFAFSQKPAAKIARDLAGHDKNYGSVLSKNKSLLKQGSKSVANSKSLQKQINELLNIGTDGSQQLSFDDLKKAMS